LVTRQVTCDASGRREFDNAGSREFFDRAATLNLMDSVRRSLRRELRKRLVDSPGPSAYRAPILSAGQGNALIEQLVIAAKPALVSRLGASEVSCLRHYSRRRQGSRPVPYPARVVARMSVNAGFYPAVDDLLDDFCRTYLDAASLIDVLGVWYNTFEDVVANETCPAATLVPLTALEPYRYAEPWSRALQGLRVLVVHPFAESIRENYAANRGRLFDDPEVLPEFRLETLTAIQSNAGEAPLAATWFNALNEMQEQMARLEFDVCVVGAGAYGLPLAAHAKRLGRVAVHLGGATQIMFGIRGRRWDKHEIAMYYNEWWPRPKPSETPRHAQSVEGGCYW
jgi:hypothetical protein